LKSDQCVFCHVWVLGLRIPDGSEAPEGGKSHLGAMPEATAMPEASWRCCRALTFRAGAEISVRRGCCS
jgi:hypothetical protein